MPDPHAVSPVEAWTPMEAETVALAYLRAAKEDRWAALVRLATDALTDIDARDAVICERGRQVFNGFVRGGLGD